MAKIEQYRQFVQSLLTKYADNTSNSDVEVQLIFDTERDHYQWMSVGWRQLDRIYRCIIHFDIKDGKIWIQQNLTEVDLAEELVLMGVPTEDIVPGLIAPYKRQYTGFSVA
ncbi:XisI protein [Brasilonema bromeliae]|uniref:XisI protein n=1 Tax=Brasilonema bromeliae SPC951 TaxID=385972 RepID=A0ABX1PDP9_9CYAN|nr:XisI protein [Brasilonema bromeliae]NMG21706.1 XisI protein [Brasilonema bromeliae SPC951]